LTLEITETKDDVISFRRYIDNKYSRYTDKMKVTIDLLNFIKVTYEYNLWETEPWKVFYKARPVLANLVSGFGLLEDSAPDDVRPALGEHGMKVELVHLHAEDSDEHSRATWRIKCPLSVSVQILRHRNGSYNMVSGRYKTIRQEMYKTPDDIKSILEAAGVLERFDNTLELVNATIDSYLITMKQLMAAKKGGKISNDEYKRARECVRFVLPEGRMTELYVTYYLSDFYGSYKKLRDSTHAQTEHIWIAQEMARSVEGVRQQN
jgi:flavin-dependent thymidylate synthase